MRSKHFFLAGVALCNVFAAVHPGLAQGTAITYQGRLNDSGGPANGVYDLRFGLFADPAFPLQVAGPLTNSAVGITNGQFSTVLDFGEGVFSGGNRWLEIGVRTNGSAADYATLSPRQKVLPTPYAIYAASANLAATATVANGLSAGAITGLAIQDGGITGAKLAGGQVVKSLNGLSDIVTLSAGANVTLTTNGNGLQVSSSGGASSGWTLGGNSATTPSNFLGTLDNHTLEFRVNNARGLRLEPTGDSPNVIGGASVNSVAIGVQSATIGGGGSIAAYGAPFPNQVMASYGTIGGGLGNSIRNNAFESTLGGGNQNLIDTNAYRAVIGGGILNYVSGNTATVSGGAFNDAIGDHATISGGYSNAASSSYSTVGGGDNNAAGQTWSTVGGGVNNQASGSAAIVSGGFSNRASGQDSAVGGGAFNWASGLNSTIAGGSSNTATNTDATVGGGEGNYVAGASSVISGGYFNKIDPAAFNAAIGGGYLNYINGDTSMIPGGDNNACFGFRSFAAGHRAKAFNHGCFVWADSNDADFGSTANDQFSVRAGGGVVLSDSTPALSFGSTTRQMLNLYGAFYGIGVQPATLYFRSFDTFCWFQQGSHIDNALDPGVNGTTLMKLESFNPGQHALGQYGLLTVGALQINGGSDVAEPFQMSSPEIPRGSVVVIDDSHPGRLKLSDRAYDQRVAGIVSGANGINPGISLSQQGVLEGGQNVALSGRVYVLADASNGGIRPGDLLTTSGAPGRAMKVTEHAKAQGAILGKAMSPLAEGTGTVLVLVTLQ